MAGGGREPGRSVTSKVLAIIEVFERSRRSMPLSEVAAQAGLPVSTTHRLVAEMTEWGLLSRSANGNVQLGIRLWAIAQNVGRQLRETARPFIQDLYSLTGETSQLAVRDGAMALYIERIYGTRRLPRASRVGGRLPLHATAVGKVILALDEPWVRQGYLKRPLERLAPSTQVNPARLARELDEVQRQEYATTFEEVRAGSCSIAVPVYHTGRLGAAIGLVLPSAHARQMTRHLPVLRGVAKKIEQHTAHIPLETLLGNLIDPLPDRPREH